MRRDVLSGKVLSDGQVEEIRDAGEKILETVGVKVMDDEMLALCRKAGARVNEASGVVRLPRSLLRELIAQAPRQYTAKGLEGAEWTLGDSQQWGFAITSDPWIIDYETQQPRHPCRDDIRRNTIIGQQLDYVMGLSCMDFPVTDAPGPNSYLHALQEHLLHHAKHNFVYATSVESMQRWLRIGKILNRGKDLHGSRLFSMAVAMLSPLAITSANADLLRIACEYEFPVAPTVCPTAGMTSPYSFAGTLAQGNAEALFVLALMQMVKPGNPFMYAFGPAVGNMRSGACLYYTLDKIPWKLAHVQLANSYNVPVLAECGGSMVHQFDQQSGAEGMLFMLSAVSSGAHLISGLGSTLNALGHSTEMMLIQDEYFRAAKFLTQGIRTDAEHLALEAIDRVGPGGEFMTDDLTLKYMRGGEFIIQELFDQSGELSGSSTLLERAHEKVERMVAASQSPVPQDIQEELRRFFHDELAGT